LKILSSTEQDYESHINEFKAMYSQDLVISQNISSHQATKTVETEMARHLPAGQHTQGHSFHTIFEQQQKVGHLWFCVENNVMYLCHIWLLKEFQGQGKGTRALDWLKTKGQILGCNSIKLNVFAHNTKGHDFYNKIGFQVSNIHMKLDLM
jgi:RimJ/RimL family protein N-acetyltransferase